MSEKRRSVRWVAQGKAREEPATTSASIFPNELIEMIFSHVNDSSTLTTLSTASRAFRPIAEKQLYQTICFGLRLYRITQVAQSMVFVRTLDITSKGHILMKHIAKVESVHVCHPHNGSGHDSTNFLRRFIPSLPNLLHLSISDPSVRFGHIVPLRGINHITRLVSLHVYTVIDSALFALIKMNPELTAIGLYNGHMHMATDYLIRHAGMLDNIQSLELGGCSEGAPFFRMTDLILGIPEGRLQNIRLIYSIHDISMFPKVGTLRRFCSRWHFDNRSSDQAYFEPLRQIWHEIRYLGKLIFKYWPLDASHLATKLSGFTSLTTLHCELEYGGDFKFDPHFLEEVCKVCPTLNMLVVEYKIAEAPVTFWWLDGESWTEGMMERNLADSLWKGGSISVGGKHLSF